MLNFKVVFFCRSWSPICYHLTYVRGLIFEARGQFEEARQCYENTLSVNPTHLSSLYHLGRVYYQLGFYRLSEQTLRVRFISNYDFFTGNFQIIFLSSRHTICDGWILILMFFLPSDGIANRARSWGHMVKVGRGDRGLGLWVSWHSRGSVRGKHPGVFTVFLELVFRNSNICIVMVSRSSKKSCFSNWIA